jgi:hypothetical protein
LSKEKIPYVLKDSDKNVLFDDRVANIRIFFLREMHLTKLCNDEDVF